MQETWVPPLIWEDPTCHRATQPTLWAATTEACMPRACAPRQQKHCNEKPVRCYQWASTHSTRGPFINEWKVKVAEPCQTLCDPMDYTVRGILQARILEWVGPSLLRGIFPTQGSNPGLPHCRWILYQLSHKYKKRVTVKRGHWKIQESGLWVRREDSQVETGIHKEQGRTSFLRGGRSRSQSSREHGWVGLDAEWWVGPLLLFSLWRMQVITDHEEWAANAGNAGGFMRQENRCRYFWKGVKSRNIEGLLGSCCHRCWPEHLSKGSPSSSASGRCSDAGVW